MAFTFGGTGRALGQMTFTGTLGQATSGMAAFTFSAPYYTGANQFANLETEIINNIASNLDAASLQAFRATSRQIEAATFFNFVQTFLPSMTVVGASVSLRNKAGIKSNYRVQSGSDKSTNQEAAALLAAAPQLTTLTIREGLGAQRKSKKASGQQSWAGAAIGSPTSDKSRHKTAQLFAIPVLKAVITTPCSHLANLTIDDATIGGTALISALRAHSGSLTYVCLRGITMTNGSVAAVLQFTKKDMQLTRLILDSLISGTRGYEMAPPSMVQFHANRTPWGTVAFREIDKNGQEQQWVAGQWNASMKGAKGVEKGIEAILGFDGWRT